MIGLERYTEKNSLVLALFVTNPKSKDIKDMNTNDNITGELNLILENIDSPFTKFDTYTKLYLNYGFYQFYTYDNSIAYL